MVASGAVEGKAGRSIGVADEYPGHIPDLAKKLAVVSELKQGHWNDNQGV